MRKGRELDDDKVGVAVPTACKNCAGLQANYLKKPDGRDPPHPCRVAIDPLSFRSVKCGNCIASKRECCFKWDNPGIEYPPEKIQALQRIEEHKIAGRKAARQTVQKRKRPSEE
jgi:hypothetical protein